MVKEEKEGEEGIPEVFQGEGVPFPTEDSIRKFRNRLLIRSAVFLVVTFVVGFILGAVIF